MTTSKTKNCRGNRSNTSLVAASPRLQTFIELRLKVPKVFNVSDLSYFGEHPNLLTVLDSKLSLAQA